MDKKRLSNALKSKIVLIFALVCMLCFSCFALVACGNDNSNSGTTTDPTYTYPEDADDSLIKNGGFKYGTADVKAENFPKTSITGWTRSTDNSAETSQVNSGVVSVKASDWKVLAKTLYKDTEYKAYLNEKGLIDANKSDDENIDSIVENFLKNPSDKDGDGYVYMLNNYISSKKIGWGTAQKLASSSAVSLSAGKIGKFSVWLKTQNITGAFENEYGANIRLVNSFNGNSQSEFRLNAIRADEWTEYVIYVKADSLYSSSITLNVGLGYGDGAKDKFTYCTEGTVYFDNITFEELDEVPEGVVLDATNTAVMDYGNKEVKKFNLATLSGKTYCYDMTFDPMFYSGLTILNDEAHMRFTESTVKEGENFRTSKDIAADSNVTKTAIANGFAFDLTKASYTVKIDNGGSNFVLAPGQLAVVKFTIKNELSSFGARDVFADVADIFGSEVKMRKTAATFSNSDGKAVEYTIIVKNEFKSGDREFYLNLVLGPNDISKVNYAYELATGKIELSNVKSYIIDEPDNDNNNVYNFAKSAASATVSLYAGYSAAPTEDNSTVSYSIETAPSKIGEIINRPTDAKAFTGVVPDHSYVKESTNSAVNTRSGNGDAEGNLAGVINTKYLANYSFVDTDKLAWTTEDDDIQPIMIYNKTANHYGFIGDVKSVAANALASVSVTLRVTGGAKAYVYLVDTNGYDKDVLDFTDFTVNYACTGAPIGTEINGKDLKFALVIDESMMKSDGWVTVKFFVAAGKTALNFRTEVWNGARTEGDDTASSGYVFVKDVTVTSSSAFTEASRMEDTFSVSGNPLFDEGVTAFEKEGSVIYAYTRELNENEIKYNKEYPDTAVSYSAKYVWAKNSTCVYGIFNTLDVTENNPYDDIDNSDSGSGCTATTDPSAFWLSFSSILLGVVLIAAFVALIVKNVRRKRKANASDAKSHYTVKSRISASKNRPVKVTKAEEPKDEEEPEVPAEETKEETASEENKTLDEYVYGDVQDFGSEEKPEDKE